MSSWRRGRDGISWLPVERILWYKTNSAHRDHLHVVGYPRKTGTPPLTNPGMPASTREIYDAILDYFPGTRIGIYNRRPIAGTSTWSQHSWSNALDVYAYGAAGQQKFFDMLTAKTRPEGGGEIDVKEVYARLQASLIRAGHNLGDWDPYLPSGDPDSLPGADGIWGADSRTAQDAANRKSSSGADATARAEAAKAHARLDGLHSI